MIDPRREWSRREFLASTALALGWTALGRGVWADEQPPVMPLRPLGKTGLQVSLLGLGAYPVGSLPDEDKAIGVVHRLLDVGVNYLDTAPSYSNGTSELRVGKAIRGKRDKVILATKTLPRDRKGAMKDLEASLVRLGTDHVDLWQIHSIRNHKDVDALFDDNGSVRAGEDAIKAGKVRFLGVTGHTNPELHLRVIKEYDFATMLM
ncbi:MAG: aldo/keto reductase, partial [Planctomycetota bacterium]|nr:aldo/keto reductase [Planctomycetota bacterium]